MLHRVRDLSPEQRQAAETLLGHALSEDELLSIRSVRDTPILPAKLSPGESLASWQSLNQRYPVDSQTDAEAYEMAATEAIRFARLTLHPFGTSTTSISSRPPISA